MPHSTPSSLGAVRWPARLPDHVTLAPLIGLRQAFDLYACVRPARTFPGVQGPLRRTEPIDVVVVRENSEDEYIDNGGLFASGAPQEIAVQTTVHTRRGVELHIGGSATGTQFTEAVRSHLAC